jgi:hypothetical protein
MKTERVFYLSNNFLVFSSIFHRLLFKFEFDDHMNCSDACSRGGPPNCSTVVMHAPGGEGDRNQAVFEKIE